MIDAITFDPQVHTRTELIEHLAIRDGFECYLCPRPFTEDDRPTIDHKYPLSKGGGWELENLKLAHRRCNQDKADRLFLDDGTLEEKQRRISYRQRQENKRQILEEFCELCQNGRMLSRDESCPECGRGAVMWSWQYKMTPNDCPHSGRFWCWMDACGIIDRQPAMVDVLNGDIDPE